jgi:hypothetical protein
VPVGIVWGAEDPWEKVAWGRKLAADAGVTDYIELPAVGHCPQARRHRSCVPTWLKGCTSHLRAGTVLHPTQC